MMKKKVFQIAAAVCTGMLLSTTPVLAAETAEYTVTLRPGSIAQFSDEFINAYVSTYGAEVTGKTGSIKVKLNPGESIPMLPDDGDLVYKDSAKGRYTMNTDWYPDTNVVTGNESFVVKYDALVNAVEYKVRYVDRQSGEDAQLLQLLHRETQDRGILIIASRLQTMSVMCKARHLPWRSPVTM